MRMLWAAGVGHGHFLQISEGLSRRRVIRFVLLGPSGHRTRTNGWNQGRRESAARSVGYLARKVSAVSPVLRTMNSLGSLPA